MDKFFQKVRRAVFFLFLPQLCYCYGSTEIFRQFPNKYFIETGSYLGDGIRQAVRAGCFEAIHSIELNEGYFNHLSRAFSRQKNVTLWQGNSGDLLPLVLSQIDAPATFWLDAHYSGGDTARGDRLSPILEELDSIQRHPIHTHTILIDDVRLFGTSEFDYVTLDQIIEKLKEINPDYQFKFLDCAAGRGDVLVAYVSSLPLSAGT